jgi:hypothetical protein
MGGTPFVVASAPGFVLVGAGLEEDDDATPMIVEGKAKHLFGLFSLCFAVGWVAFFTVIKKKRQLPKKKKSL